jgi:epoxyqueuosine reductase QueG
MKIDGENIDINKIWEQKIKEFGTDHVFFVDASIFPSEAIEEYTCIIFFTKALSKEYIDAIRTGQKPKTKEIINIERKMDSLAVKITGLLENDGYKSVSKLKFGLLPHKTVALRAGLGFIGKNNLLVNSKYGCALLFGKVLTTAPFVTMSKKPMKIKCGDCNICVDICPTKALYGKTWNITTTRDEMMIRKLCNLCLKCLIWCPYTEKYANSKIS